MHPIKEIDVDVTVPTTFLSSYFSESLRMANAISDKLAQFSSGSNTRIEQNE